MGSYCPIRLEEQEEALRRSAGWSGNLTDLHHAVSSFLTLEGALPAQLYQFASIFGKGLPHPLLNSRFGSVRCRIHRGVPSKRKVHDDDKSEDEDAQATDAESRAVVHARESSLIPRGHVKLASGFAAGKL